MCDGHTVDRLCCECVIQSHDDETKVYLEENSLLFRDASPNCAEVFVLWAQTFKTVKN